MAEEWSFPYISGSGANGTCPDTPASDYAVAGIEGYITLPENDAASVMATVRLL